MTRYDLTRMGPHEFQRLSQALLLAEFGSHIQIHGMGPDGGRDASTRDELRVSKTNAPWTGFTVFQVKHKEELTKRTADAQWLLKETKAEIAKWLKRPERPDQLLIITNVALTPAPGGGEELLNDYVDSVASSLGLNDWDIWHAEKICRLLDLHTSVRQKYLGSVMGDLLVTLSEVLSAEQMELADVISSHLARTFKAEKYAQLDQGGGVDDRKVPLARVFVDVPFIQSEEEENLFAVEDYPAQEGAASTAHIIELANHSATPIDRQNNASRGRFIIIGGPGQGKSTLGRFLCQIYRAELLGRHEFLSLQAEVRAEIEYTRSLCSEEGIPLPTSLRFPIFVTLPKFANYLAKNPQGSLISFIAERIGIDVSVSALHRWLRKYPWLLVLDGLDEVPLTANREAMLEAVSAFHDSADACGADLVVIATSRPQGYKDEFSNYYRMSLSGLTKNQALRYSRRLTTIRHGEGSEKAEEIMGRVENAANQPETARLMKTPLQVTILVLLLSRSSRAPSQRFALFSNYYDVIYARELEKDTPNASILDRFKSFVDLLHWRVGLRLQYEAAKASHTEAFLSRDEVKMELESMLEGEGYENAERSELASQIMDSAADRLVFLVANVSERFGFELRSLQEFCAARGLLEGNDEQVYQRLAAIVCSDHWRNVFLLACGAIFSDNSARRDMITSICNELNAGDVPDFPGSDGACMGSRLAIDILTDRIADTAPRHQRMLTEAATSLIVTPGRNTWSSLAFVDFTDAISRNKFESALSQSLSSAEIFERIGALVNIAAQAEMGNDAALQRLFSSLECESVEDRIKIFKASTNSTPARFGMNLPLLRGLLDFSPSEAASLLNPLPLSLMSGAGELPAEVVPPSVRMIVKLIGLVRDAKYYSASGRANLEVRIFPIRSGGSAEDPLGSAASDACLAGDMGSWDFLRQSVIFANEPSPDTWETATGALAQANEEDVSAWWRRLPWPLAIWWENGREATSITANVVAEWRTAQQEWSEDFTLEDAIIVQPQLFPRVGGIPASTVIGPRSGSTLRTIHIERIALDLAKLPRDRFWNVRVNWLWNVLGRPKMGATVIGALPDNTCLWLAQSSGLVPANLIIELADGDRPGSLAKADEIAKVALGFTMPAFPGQDFEASVTRLCEVWSLDRSRWGLARVLVRFPNVTVARSWDEVRDLDDDEAGIFEKLLVIWGGDWNGEHESEIAHYLFQFATGQKTAPIGFFDKFIGGRGGAKLAEILRSAQDPRYMTVVNNLFRHYSSKVVSIPQPTFRVV